MNPKECQFQIHVGTEQHAPQCTCKTHQHYVMKVGFAKTAAFHVTSAQPHPLTSTDGKHMFLPTVFLAIVKENP